jgi:hypothetical protein
MSAKVAPDGLNRGTLLRSALGFSEQARAWVKKFTKEWKGVMQGSLLVLSIGKACRKLEFRKAYQFSLLKKLA